MTDSPSPVRPRHALPVAVGLLAAMHAPIPASAFTITPYFDSTIVGASDQAQVETVINDAIGNIDSLFTNQGTIGIVFSQANGNFLGQSQTSDSLLAYNQYVSDLRAASAREPSNGVLPTAIANLRYGNDANGSGSIVVPTADLKLGLGLSGITGCYNTGGSFVAGCGQAYYGVVTLTDNTSLGLNYGTTAVAGQYSLLNAAEHEIDEILGGGGQGSMLNAIQQGITQVAGDYGVLDLYRYASGHAPSFTTSGSASAFLSVDGGNTSVVAFNQNSSGDYGDFNTNRNVQSAFSNPGSPVGYNSSSPEVLMLDAIGYNGPYTGPTYAPEPASLAVLATGIAGIGGVLSGRASGRKRRG